MKKKKKNLFGAKNKSGLGFRNLKEKRWGGGLKNNPKWLRYHS